MIKLLHLQSLTANTWIQAVAKYHALLFWTQKIQGQMFTCPVKE